MMMMINIVEMVIATGCDNDDDTVVIHEDD